LGIVQQAQMNNKTRFASLLGTMNEHAGQKFIANLNPHVKVHVNEQVVMYVGT